MLRSDSVSLGGARWIVQAAESKAQQLSSRSNTAVVDVGGNQVAHVHMDGAQVGSVDHCIKKGLYQLHAAKRNAGSRRQCRTRWAGFFTVPPVSSSTGSSFAGGIPLRQEGRLVGAVGDSGGSGEHDQTTAQVAVAAF